MSLFTDLSAFQSTPFAQSVSNTNSSDIDQLITLIDFLLLSVGFSALIIGALVGWYIRGRYESWLWLKTGIYCDDCATLVDRSKEQGGNQ